MRITDAYFAHAEAAKRYEKYRPKTHGEIIRRLLPCFEKPPLESALDVACGTGDSAAALRLSARRVVGIDRSSEMLQYAKGRCDRTELLPAESASKLGETFDLISTCMAFHWFEQESVIPEYKKVTRPGGYWLFYNFGFAGHRTSSAFNEQCDQYSRRFPSPARNRASAVHLLEADPELELLCAEEGQLGLTFDPENLIGYLTTQSNVEQRVQEGTPYHVVEQQLRDLFRVIPDDDGFLYRFRFELYQYQGNLEPLFTANL